MELVKQVGSQENPYGGGNPKEGLHSYGWPRDPLEYVFDHVAKLRLSNEQHIVPARKAIGGKWSEMYESVKVTREKAE